jgi:hypothetical protein
MKKRLMQWMALLCNVLGTVAAVYVAGWEMLLLPLYTLYTSLLGGTLTLPLLLLCAVKILLSATFGGLVWCIGYIGYNYFRGNEDPDWTVIGAGAGGQEITEHE